MHAILAVLLFSFLGPALTAKPRRAADPKKIIIETDFLSFPDDVGALALANYFHRQGTAQILGIVLNVASFYSPPAIDSINTYYGNLGIPFAQTRNLTADTFEPGAQKSPSFIKKLAYEFPENIHSGYNVTIKSPLDFYLKTLGDSKIGNVTIISIGFFNNLADLYRAPGGKDLIASKVSELVVQGGDFNATGDHRIGYNLGINVDAAQVLENWPSPVTYLGREIANNVNTGTVLKDTPASNPVREAYAIYHQKDANFSNPSGDPLTVYYGVLGLEERSFKRGNTGGRLKITPKGRNTTAVMVDAAGGNQYFLAFNDKTEAIASKVDKILAFQPA